MKPSSPESLLPLAMAGWRQLSSGVAGQYSNGSRKAIMLAAGYLSAIVYRLWP